MCTLMSAMMLLFLRRTDTQSLYFVYIHVPIWFEPLHDLACNSYLLVIHRPCSFKHRRADLRCILIYLIDTYITLAFIIANLAL